MNFNVKFDMDKDLAVRITADLLAEKIRVGRGKVINRARKVYHDFGKSWKDHVGDPMVESDNSLREKAVSRVEKWWN